MTFRAGERVRVAARTHEGHHRTPGYVKGKSGRVERVHGRFRNPETRAYGADGLPEIQISLLFTPPGTAGLMGLRTGQTNGTSAYDTWFRSGPSASDLVQ